MENTYRITAQMIYEQALAPLYEKAGKDKDYHLFFLPFLNMTLQECLSYQNQLLMSDGREPLKFAPLISNMTDIVEYEEVLTRGAIPYNISSLYFLDDGKKDEAADFRNRYVAALYETMPVLEESIIDEY